MGILNPLFAMVLLTMLIGPLMVVTRFKSVRSGAVPMDYYKTFTGDAPPEQVTQMTRHWANLFEAPTLFYVVCLTTLLLQLDSALLIWLAWAYVVLRSIHSFVHLTYNTVFHRMTAFLSSQIVLLVMWVLVFTETL